MYNVQVQCPFLFRVEMQKGASVAIRRTGNHRRMVRLLSGSVRGTIRLLDC